MTNRRTLTVLTVLIALLGGAASVLGLVPFATEAPRSVVSARGAVVELDGRGLYAYDSLSFASQGRAQDVVTAAFAVPLLLISFHLYKKGSRRASIIYGGTVGYFLYTYASYAFIVTFNRLFPVYTALLSFSLFAFILILQDLARSDLAGIMAETFRRKTISLYLLIVGILIWLMWMGRLGPALISGGIPEGLDHYSTLGIQVLDLAIIVPASLMTAWLLWKKREWGYLLSGIIIMKALTLLLAIVAMIIGQKLAGVEMNPVEIVVFLAITAANSLFLVPVLRSVPKS